MSPMRVDVQTDRDGSFRFIYEDAKQAVCIRSGFVKDVPNHTWLREVCIYANSIGWEQGKEAAKAYIDRRFAELKEDRA